ncbi:MAG TPA: hypothetical protein VHG08_18135, partial [Longimicrobium sp.]|nr:hypothetical protein [Longimicrobium sp.]
MSEIDLAALRAEPPRERPVLDLRAGMPDASGSRVIVTVLYCGQGMANFLEFYDLDQDDGDAPMATALLDFGVDLWFMSAEKKAVLVGPAVKFVTGRLQALIDAGREPRIDFTIFSHQDADHWALIDYLLWAVEDKQIDMKVGPIWYGGADWGKSASAAVGRFAAYSDQPDGEEVIPLEDGRCDYPGPTKALKDLVTWGEVAIRILASNIDVGSSDRGMRRNGTSACVVVECGGNTIILPGDATYETFEFINPKLKAYGTRSPVRPVYALSVPHHGSLRSFVSGYPRTLDYSLGRKFAELLAAENAVASAGYWNRHKHPYAEIMKVFSAYTEPDSAHDYIAYSYASSRWQAFTTTTSLYTTVLALAHPIQYKNYEFWLQKETDGPVLRRISGPGLEPRVSVAGEARAAAGADAGARPPALASAPA